MSKPSKQLSQSLRDLENWFQRQKRILPWRDEPTVYRVWVSEIMLQQTQVATVVPYFERFLKRFPTVEELARADAEEVMQYWAGLGYYSRARNLQKAAQQVVAQGGFPKDREGWLELPGIGDYTAGAILSIALDQPEAILDGNVERVLSRVKAVDRAAGDAIYKEKLWSESRAWVTCAHEIGLRPSQLNQALMELGATICVPKSPKCLLCPLSSACEARAKGDPEAYPPRKKPKIWVQVREELHCILDPEGRLLLRKREKGEWRAGLWDLVQELPSRLGSRSKLRELGSVETRHVVTRHKITRLTRVWKLEKPFSRNLMQASEPEGPALKWAKPGDSDLPMGSALKRTLQKIREEFPELRPGP